MEKNVNGIRELYHQDLINDYQVWKEKSFLYKFIWSDNIAKLLKEHFKKLPKEVEELLSQRLFWLREEASGLEHEEDKKHEEYEKKIRRLLKENMLKRPEWKRGVLKKPPKRAKERRDFWEELMLNDAAYAAGLITDTEYYLWLTEYLAIRDKYYKDNSMDDGHTWLYELLCNGLGRELGESVKRDEIQKLKKEIESLEEKLGNLEKELVEIKRSQEREGTEWSKKLRKLERTRKRNESRKREKILELEKIMEFEKQKAPKKPEMLRERRENIRDKAGVGRDLVELAGKLRHERETGGAEISNRLHKLNYKGETKMEDYLPWLTRQLEKMAIHIKIKNWLQDNGYPIVDKDRLKKPDKAKERDKTKNQLQEYRKEDFSMRIFEAFCDSEKGYEFSRKEDGAGKDEDWVVKNGFCFWKPDGIRDYLQALLQTLEQKRQEARSGEDKEGGQDFYFPLATDLHSGCVFFLAGKKYYDIVYKKSKDAKLQEKYKKEENFFCYDYLRLDRRVGFDDPEVAFRLQPTFHENVGKKYTDVLTEFIHYCNGEARKCEPALVVAGDYKHYCEDVDMPRKKIKAYNQEEPDNIPEVFKRFFDGPKDPEDEDD